MVIRATCKDYLATLPEEEADSYVDDMEQSVGDSIQQKIDEAETWLEAAENIRHQRHRGVNVVRRSGRMR